MKTLLTTLLLASLALAAVHALDYKVTKTDPVIVATHDWKFTELELREALIAYIKSKGGTVPHGPISISGLDMRAQIEKAMVDARMEASFAGLGTLKTEPKPPKPEPIVLTFSVDEIQ